MPIFRIAVLMLFGLFIGFVTAHVGLAGSPEAMTAEISQKQLDTYIEVTRAASQNPSLTDQEMDALLQTHKISRTEYDSIAKQVQSDQELKMQVDKRLGESASALDKFKEIPGVKTKLKEPQTGSSK